MNMYEQARAELTIEISKLKIHMLNSRITVLEDENKILKNKLEEFMILIDLLHPKLKPLTTQEKEKEKDSY